VHTVYYCIINKGTSKNYFIGCSLVGTIYRTKPLFLIAKIRGKAVFRGAHNYNFVNYKEHIMSLAIKVYEAFKDDENKAKILADVIEQIEMVLKSNQVATQQDLINTQVALTKEIEKIRADLTIKIEQVRTELIKEIEKVRADLKIEIEQVRADLTKEIEKVRGEIKETELRLQKEIEKVRADLKIEIEQVRADLTKEIEKVRGEIKETELKLQKEIEKARTELTIVMHNNHVSALRWLVGLMITQLLAISGIFVAIIQLFLK